MKKLVSLGSMALVCLGLVACGPDRDGTATGDSMPPHQDAPQQTAQVLPPQSQPMQAASAPDITKLTQQYAGKKPAIIGVMEAQLDGANALLVTLNVPLAPQQNFDSFLQLTDKASGTVDGHWELADNLMELWLRHLEPERQLELLVSPGLKALNGLALAEPYQKRLTTSAVQPVISFASQGSLLPDMADGLPVISVNVPKVDVDFFRVRDDAIGAFVTRWGIAGSLYNWDSRQLNSLAELVYSGRFELPVTPNTRETLQLPMRNIAALQPPGVYFAVLKGAGDYRGQYPVSLFTRSNIALSAHRYAQRLDVFAQTLEGNGALEGVTLTLLNGQGEQETTAVTDAQGYATLTPGKKPVLLLARKGDQTTVLQLNTAALNLTDFRLDGPNATPLQFFVFGPRDLYRPGETVLLNALLRDQDGHAVGNQPVRVTVIRPDGRQLRQFVWQADASGLYQYALPIGENEQTGNWRVQFEPGGEVNQTSYSFKVEDFLPERLALALAPTETKPLSPEEAAVFRVASHYLYGAPASGNRLSGHMRLEPVSQAVPALADFSFGLSGSAKNREFQHQIKLPEITLNDAGEATVTVQSEWQGLRVPALLTYQASVHETGGRAVSRHSSRAVWPAARLPGLRLVGGDKRNAIGNNSTATFEIVVSDSEGNKLAAEQLKVRAVRERRNYYWSYTNDERWEYRYNSVDMLLDEQLLNIAAGQVATFSFPVEWGPYRVEVEDSTTGIVSNIAFWAGYYQQNTTDAGGVRPDQIKLAMDKPAYRAGDTVRVTVTPPAAGSGYLLVEGSDGPLWWREIEVAEGGDTFEIPVAGEWTRHDLYITAMVVRPAERKTLQTPRRALGILHLPLDRDGRRLQVSVDAPQKMRPQQLLKTRIQVRNSDGMPLAQTRVIVSAVDSGVLNITDYVTPDPFAAFFARKRYAADVFDVYGRLIEPGGSRQAKLAFGGDSMMTRGGRRPLEKVQIVALQSDVVMLDAEGRAEIALPVPDFNGELRLMVQAWSDDHYGSAETHTVVAAPLVAELAKPRFMASGDRSRLALDLTNLTAQTQTLTVRWQVSGQLNRPPDASGDQQLGLTPGQRLTLFTDVIAQGSWGEGQVRLEIDGIVADGEELPPLQRDWNIGIRPAYPAQIQRFDGVLQPGEVWTLPPTALQGLDADTAEMRIEFNDRPPLGLADHIRELRAYPYGCLEQTVSQLYVSLFFNQQQLAALGIQTEEDDKRRHKIGIGIERILGMMRDRGGFGVWSNENEEHFWLTVYATDFLQQARAHGFDVPDAALKQALTRLEQYLADPTRIISSYGDDLTALRFTVQAYAALVLARNGKAPLAQLRALYDRRTAARGTLPLLQLGIALRLMGDGARADTLIRQALDRHEDKDGTGYWFNDYSSPLRDHALIYALMEQYDIAAPQRAPRLLALSDEIQGKKWLSTQERNALLLASTALMQKPLQQNWSVAVATQDQQLNFNPQRSSGAVTGRALSQPLTAYNAGQGEVYRRVILSAYPLQTPQEQKSESMSIRREFRGIDGKVLDISQLRSGDLVLVHLTIDNRSRIPDALVVDMLPAGLELENQNLADKAVTLKDVGGEISEWQRLMQVNQCRIKHQEFRADRYVAAVDIDGFSTPLLYLARAVTPGHYRVPPPMVESMYRPQLRAIGATPDFLTVHPR